MEAREGFHRYVAVLFAVTIPALGFVELSRAMGSPLAPARLAGYLALTAWALYVAFSEKPNALPLLLATMSYTGSLIILEALFGTDVSAFDFTTTFGLMMVLSVLAGTLVAGSRPVWAAAIAGSVSLWVVAVGVLLGEDPEVVALVADDGPGVSVHESDLIFERYYRSAESPTQPGSVGIGLAVSRQLAEMMDGALDYVPAKPHSRFELSLPATSLTVFGESDRAEIVGRTL